MVERFLLVQIAIAGGNRIIRELIRQLFECVQQTMAEESLS